MTILKAKHEKEMLPATINLIDHYAATYAKLVEDLEALDVFLSENEENIFRCTCEDGDIPRGSWEYDTNAYNHADNCPSGSGYHYHVLLAGLARYFKEHA